MAKRDTLETWILITIATCMALAATVLWVIVRS